MTLRAIAMLILALALMVGQLLATATPDRRTGSPASFAAAILARGAAAQDDNDNDDNDNDGDDDDDDDDGDNGDLDADNDDDDHDNGDDDDDDDDNDNGDEDDDDDNDNGDDDDDDDNDNGARVPVPGVEVPAREVAPPPPTATPILVTPTPTPRPTRTPTPTPVPTTADQAVTNGQDLRVSLTGDRVVVQVFASTPPGITLRLYLVDPSGQPQTPGARAGDLIFRIEATDPSGAALATLPAEVNLSVRYDESDVDGLDDGRVTLAWLDPTDNQWKSAPRLLADPETNFVAASIRDLGVYAVVVP